MSTLQDLNQVLSRKQDILENAAGVEKIKKSGKLTAREQIVQSARLALMKPLVALLIVALAALPIALMALVPGAIMWVPLLWVILSFGVSFWAAMLATCKAFALKPADHQAQDQ